MILYLLWIPRNALPYKALRPQGYSIGQIIRKTKFHRCFVERWYHRRNIADKPCTGRPSKLTPAAEVPAQPTVKHPPKLPVCGGISHYGKPKLFVFTRNMNAEFYEGILEERLLTDATRLFGGCRWPFQ
jgi:hypothetical protein